MATKRIKDLTALTTSLKPTDALPAGLASPDQDRKVTFSVLLNSMGFASYAVGTLPGGFANGFIYVTDGRKVGEGAGLGTGVVCSWDGANWVTVDAGTAVAA